LRRLAEIWAIGRVSAEMQRLEEVFCSVEHGLAIPGKQAAHFILQEVISIGKNKLTRGEADVRRCARAAIVEH